MTNLQSGDFPVGVIAANSETVAVNRLDGWVLAGTTYVNSSFAGVVIGELPNPPIKVGDVFTKADLDVGNLGVRDGTVVIPQYAFESSHRFLVFQYCGDRWLCADSEPGSWDQVSGAVRMRVLFVPPLDGRL